MVGTIRAPNPCCPDALAVDKCICHDEYALLRQYIDLLIRSEKLQRQQLQDHTAERVKTYEQYISEMRLLAGMCRACKIDGDIVAKKDGDKSRYSSAGFGDWLDGAMTRFC